MKQSNSSLRVTQLEMVQVLEMEMEMEAETPLEMETNSEMAILLATMMGEYLYQSLSLTLLT
jgi:hypothetical protein